MIPRIPRDGNVAYHAGMSHQDGLVDFVDLPLPVAAEAVQGLRLAHITDLHIHGHTRRHRRIATALQQVQPDLIMFTGDYVTRWRPHHTAFEVLDRMCAAVAPRLGMFGVFGNHDPPSLREQLQGLPVTWLSDGVHRFADLPLEVWGADTTSGIGCDGLALAEQVGGGPETEDRPVRLVLCHLPSFLPTASDLGADAMFSGHTHGGQIRLPGARALRNSTSLPLRLTSGLLRLRHTLCCISRGLGEVLLPIRTFCPPHLPVFTLLRGDLPGQYSDHVVNVRRW